LRLFAGLAEDLVRDVEILAERLDSQCFIGGSGAQTVVDRNGAEGMGKVSGVERPFQCE
jgi:hypothetical protein